MLVAYVVLDGFDLGRGRALQAGWPARPTSARPWSAAPSAGLGRQRGLAAGRRRHALLRVSRALRLQLQRLLPAAHDGALAADRPRARARAARATSADEPRPRPATPSSWSRACCCRSSSARRSATSSAACRSTPTGTSSCRCGRDFSPGRVEPGVLDWYTVPCGVVALVGAWPPTARTTWSCGPAVPVARDGRGGSRASVRFCCPSLTLASLAATAGRAPRRPRQLSRGPRRVAPPRGGGGQPGGHGAVSRAARPRIGLPFGASCVYLVAMLGGAAFAPLSRVAAILGRSGPVADGGGRGHVVVRDARGDGLVGRGRDHRGLQLPLPLSQLPREAGRRRRVRLRWALTEGSLADGDVVDEAGLAHEGGHGEHARAGRAPATGASVSASTSSR